MKQLDSPKMVEYSIRNLTDIDSPVIISDEESSDIDRDIFSGYTFVVIGEFIKISRDVLIDIIQMLGG